MGKLLVIKGADFSSVAVAQVTPIANMVSITVVASPSGGGTVSGSGSYAEGTSVQISAVAKTGYAFSQWSDGNTNATRTIIANSSTTYTAEFTSAPIGSIMSMLTDNLKVGAVGSQGKNYDSTDNTRNCIFGLDLLNFAGRHLRLKLKSDYASIATMVNNTTPQTWTYGCGYRPGTDVQKGSPGATITWGWDSGKGNEYIITIQSNYACLMMNIALSTTSGESPMPSGATAETYFDVAEID